MKLKGIIVYCKGKPVEAAQAAGRGAARRLQAVRRDLEKTYPGCKIQRFTQDTRSFKRTRW